MEETLIRLNRHWEGRPYLSLYRRELLNQLLKKKDLPHIQVLTGIRRSGKSTIFELIISDLIASGVDPRSILRLNLDEPVFTSLWNNPSELYSIIEKAEVLTGIKSLYLFLDEVQQVKNWELFAKGAYDTRRFRKIYITGSTSDLLDKQFSTLLSGRYFSNVVRPFSVKELFAVHGFNDNLSILARKTEALRLIDRYMLWGSFPEIVLHELSDDIKTELLQSYYESIVLKDCITRNRVRDIDLFYRLMHYLLTNTGSLFNYNSLAQALDSNENTVKSYLSFAVRSYILVDATNFAFSVKPGARPDHKSYCIDNGLMNAVSFRFSEQKGKMLENAVYNELVNKGYNNISFVRRNGECDFIAQKDNAFHAFQVCYELTAVNRKREAEGFYGLNKQVNLVSRSIITYNQEGEEDSVQIRPFYRWCLED